MSDGHDRHRARHRFEKGWPHYKWMPGDLVVEIYKEFLDRGICTGTSHTSSSGNTFSTFPVFCAKEPAPGLVVNSPVRHDGIPISSPETSEQTEGGREGLNVECQPDANP
jgi:hypothetical protein